MDSPRIDARSPVSVLIRVQSRNFPGGPVVKNLPCNAGDTGLIPGRGTKILHAVEKPGPCATTKTQHSQVKFKDQWHQDSLG